MGSFYTSHTVRGPSRKDVLDWLGGRPAFVSAAENGNVTVLDEACESQDPQQLADLGSALSARFDCPVLAVVNHDDDLLYMALFEHGHLTDQYDSSPGLFDDEWDDENDGGEEGGAHGENGMPTPQGGDAARLTAAFGGDAAAVEMALRRTDLVFAHQRHTALAEALGLPLAGVNIGYEYAQAGDWPSPASSDAFVHTGGL